MRIFEIFENLAFQRFEPIIIFDFSWRFRKKALEKHISKQMRVYKQITFFHKKSKFLKIFFPDRKIDFLRGGPIFGEKNGNRNRDEPEPDRTGTGLNQSRPKPNRTVLNRGIPALWDESVTLWDGWIRDTLGRSGDPRRPDL